MSLLNYIVVKDTIYEQTVAYVPDSEFEDDLDILDWLCTRAAKTYCFSDCTDEEVVLIVHDGRELEYAGWQPDMLFEFIDKVTKKVVWQAYFPNWEH